MRARGAAALAAAYALAGCGGAAPPAASPSPMPSSPPAVLQVTVRAPDRAAEVATAFATGDGRAVTVAHAIAGRRSVLVAAPEGAARRARVLRADVRLDLALLAVPGLKAATLRTARARAGQAARVLVVRGGRTRSLRATVRRLITANVREAPDANAQVRHALELDAEVIQGDSGAPVLDREGRVIGAVFAQASDRDDRAYAVDMRDTLAR
jgi:S1-C subfamily serine protease